MVWDMGYLSANPALKCISAMELAYAHHMHRIHTHLQWPGPRGVSYLKYKTGGLRYSVQYLTQRDTVVVSARLMTVGGCETSGGVFRIADGGSGRANGGQTGRFVNKN